MEKWKTISGYENYQVSNLGNVRSLNYLGHKGNIKLLNPMKNSGYYSVKLYSNGKSKTFGVHQLVAMTFLNHIPDGGKLVIDHINSDSLDNRLENLKIVSHRENTSKERTLKSGFPVGVDFHKGTQKYRSRIRINGKPKHLGLFDTIKEASEAYQKVLQNNE